MIHLIFIMDRFFMVGRNIWMFKKFNLFWSHLGRYEINQCWNGPKILPMYLMMVSVQGFASHRKDKGGKYSIEFHLCQTHFLYFLCIVFLVYYVYCLYSVWYVLSLYYILLYCCENILVDFHLLTAVEHIVSEISWQKRNILVWVVFYQRQQFGSFGDNILYYDYDFVIYRHQVGNNFGDTTFMCDHWQGSFSSDFCSKE